MRRLAAFPKVILAGLLVAGATAVASASAANSVGADLQLTLAAAAQSNLGGTVTYVAQVKNTGPSNASSVRVAFQVPAQVQLVSMSASQGICTPRGPNTAGGGNVIAPIPPQGAPVQCLLGPLEAGAQARVTVVARANAAGTFTLKANVTADQADSNANNNQAEATTSIGQPPAAAGVDLKLSLAAPAQAHVGESIRFVADVRNAGPARASAVKLTEQLPAGARLLRTSASQGRCAAGVSNGAAASSSVTCSLGHLRAGAAARVVFVVRANAAGSLASTATVTSAQSDSTSENNTASASTAVSERTNDVGAGTGADLGVHLSGPARARRGASIAYVATILNRGPASTATVMLSTEVSSHGRALSVAVSQGSCVSATTPPSQGTSTPNAVSKTPKVPLAEPVVASGSCTLGSLAAGARAKVTIVVRAVARGHLTLRAVVSGDGTDANAANDRASVTTRIGPRRHHKAQAQGDNRAKVKVKVKTTRIVVVTTANHVVVKTIRRAHGANHVVTRTRIRIVPRANRVVITTRVAHKHHKQGKSDRDD